MTILTAEQRLDGYFYRIHLDETKVDDQGNPDPAYVREFRWPLDQDLEVSKREMKLLCELELQKMQATTLSDEGGVL